MYGTYALCCGGVSVLSIINRSSWDPLTFIFLSDGVLEYLTIIIIIYYYYYYKNNNMSLLFLAHCLHLKV